MDSLLAPWRNRPVRIASRLSPQEALRRIEGGIGSGSGVHTISGWVTGDEVRLVARRPFRNSWRPILRARVVATPGGCELVGSIGTHPAVKVFMTVWLCFAGLLAVLGAVFGTGSERLVALPPFLMIAFGLALNYFGHSLGRHDARALIKWLGRRLSAVRVDFS